MGRQARQSSAWRGAGEAVVEKVAARGGSSVYTSTSVDLLSPDCSSPTIRTLSFSSLFALNLSTHSFLSLSLSG